MRLPWPNYKVVTGSGNNIEIVSNNIQNTLIDNDFVNKLHESLDFRIGHSMNVSIGGVSRVDRLGSLNSNFTHVSGSMGGIFKKLVKVEFEFQGLRESSIAIAIQPSDTSDNQIICRIRNANKVKGLLVFETSLFGSLDVDSKQLVGTSGAGNMRLSQFQFNFEGFIEPPKPPKPEPEIDKKSFWKWILIICVFLIILGIVDWIFPNFLPSPWI